MLVIKNQLAAMTNHARCLDFPSQRCQSFRAADGSCTSEDSLSRSLALGVARWQAASRSDGFDHVQLDGTSPACLFRAVMYQRSDVCSAVKNFMFSEGALQRLPVRASHQSRYRFAFDQRASSL